MTHIFRWFALALALPLGSLSAQETPTVARGTRVRVTNDEHPHRVQSESGYVRRHRPARRRGTGSSGRLDLRPVARRHGLRVVLQR